MRLKYKARGMEMVLELGGKFNVIAGDSGSGKTLLANMADSFRQLYEDDIPGVLIPKPVVSSVVRFEKYIPVWHDAVFIIDEGFSNEDLRELMPLMLESDNYYIFITRDGLAEVPYGISCVFWVSGDENSLYVHRMYDSDLLLTRYVDSSSAIIVEDSGVGFHLVRSICHDSRLVCSAQGKANLSLNVGRIGGVPIVVFDPCGIGKDIRALVECRERRGCVLFDSASLEQEILSHVFPKRYSGFSEDDWAANHSEEQFYADQLSSLLHQFYNVSYHKSSEWLVTLLERGSVYVHGELLRLHDVGGVVRACYPELRGVPSEVE